jgi:signal transduction histidine kinase
VDVIDQQDLEQRSRVAGLTADVGLALTRSDDLRTVLQQCAQAVVDRLDAAFARIWTLNDSERVLELQASAGMYTHLDGPHGRVPVGKFKIGLIAEERRPHLTNDVVGDPRVGDQAWAAREGMVAFAGYPLMIGDDLVGVLAMFARHRLAPPDYAALVSVAHGIALALARWRVMERLRDSEARAVQRAEALARTTAELRRMNAELDAFAYAASHDLRAPLRGIANLAQWIEEDLQDSLRDETREMLALLRTRMHRMEALIDGILQYSRAGREHESPVEVDVAALVEELVDLLAAEAATVEIEPGLPVFVTERVPLQQVFQNLLGNAIKHGGEGVTITVSARDEGAVWRFTVADDGPGIPEAYHERIWGIFQTLEPRDKVEGTGIGLSLVKKVVEAHGGAVALESRPGAGSAFSFTWPKNNCTSCSSKTTRST